jgi:hypothetical protein
MKRTDIPGFAAGTGLKAADLNGKRVRVTVEAVDLIELEDKGKTKKKPRMTFKGRDKSLILNVTNWNRMVELTGSEDSDEWVGQDVQIYPTKVEFQGQMVDAIRVYLPDPELSEDDVPF